MKKTNTIALVGMIISIVSITLCCPIELTSYGLLIPIGLLFAAAGGICSFIGYKRSRRESFEQPLAKLALAGTIIGIASFALKLILGILILLGLAGVGMGDS